jgi:hypothetical protein
MSEIRQLRSDLFSVREKLANLLAEVDEILGLRESNDDTDAFDDIEFPDEAYEEPDKSIRKMEGLDFALAGKAVFTLTGPDGKHYTYRINKADPNPRFPGTTWWVNLGTGYEDSVPMGRLSMGPNQQVSPETVDFTPSKGVNTNSPSCHLFLDWFAAEIMGQSNDSIEFRHEGRCCVCSRPLTNPESIDAGIGPECASKGGF